ncbi:leucine-rich repeat-containing protein, partial [Tanacetum coccineum]
MIPLLSKFTLPQGLVLSSCFVFLVALVGFIPWLPVKRDLCADDSVSAISGSLLAVVDNAGLVGFIGIGIGFRAVEGGGCAAGVGRRSVGCCGGGVGKGNGGFWKTVSKTKSGLFEVLIVSKWNWKVWVVPFSFLQDILPQIPTLEILILRNTFLNGFIPNSISKCTSLRILDLSRNNLTGRIPRQIASLPRMNMSASSYPTYLSGDVIEDELQDLIVNWKKYPQQLQNLHFFVLLDLSGNNISGEIPASLGNLKALKQLNISHNKISGNIPMSLGNLTSIESFDVSHNELSGSIPQSLDQLGQLTVLDVSNNMLTGKIPRGRKMDTMDALGFQNNSELCGMQINKKCPEDIPSSEGRVEEDEDLSWMCWEGTWIGFPIGFFSTILIMSYLLKFIQLFKICDHQYCISIIRLQYTAVRL